MIFSMLILLLNKVASLAQSCLAVPPTSSTGQILLGPEKVVQVPQAKLAHWGHKDHRRYQLLYFSLNKYMTETSDVYELCDDPL